VRYFTGQQTTHNTCMVVGGLQEVAVASLHPARLRNPADKAKLISSNDTSGFTFRGRFHTAGEAVSVGFDITQKAHNALRWLIRRQSYRHAEQVIVSWSVGGEEVPDLLADTFDLAAKFNLQLDNESADTAQAFALQLKKSISGYAAKLAPTADIVVMGLDSTGGLQGRMAITFYRELLGSEFLDRVETWHNKMTWPQNFGANKHFIGAPAPKDIAEAAFGRRLDDKLKKSTVERLLPCIVDGQQIPRDLVVATSRRASNRSAFKPTERWDWEKCLGIACALFKAYHIERNYQMALEQDRTTRDYLYGCLLAIAEDIERHALRVANENEKRDTMAARLMQRFSDHPFSTWKTIELALAPYQSRLRAQRGGLMFKRDQLLDDTMGKFAINDFTNDTPLTCEFLLGYHCQRQNLRLSKATPNDDSVIDTNE
jgi:CRISPR-associated protein Csd1